MVKRIINYFLLFCNAFKMKDHIEQGDEFHETVEVNERISNPVRMRQPSFKETSAGAAIAIIKASVSIVSTVKR